MARFFGRFEHSLDQKGRVTLPARLRQAFDTTVYASEHHDRCLALWTPDQFEKQLAAVEATQDLSPKARNDARFWLAGIAELELDKQGRVALPRYLCDYAGLDGAVLLVGALNRIEVWNPQEWAARVAPSEATFTNPPAIPSGEEVMPG